MRVSVPQSLAVLYFSKRPHTNISSIRKMHAKIASIRLCLKRILARLCDLQSVAQICLRTIDSYFLFMF